MLERIVLKNFQKHESLDLCFDGGFNLITGHNGWGKSAILRAIQWVTTNDGDSKSFRRTYLGSDGNRKVSTETSVTLYIDGQVIERVYSSSKNEYYLNGVKLTGFGRGVPEPVKELCKMQSFNVSEQFAPLFLIGDSSGGSVARELGEIASLEEMEELSNAVNADVRKYNENKANQEAVRETMIKALAELSTYTPIFNEVEKDTKLYEEKYNSDSTRVSEVLQTINKLMAIPNEIDSYSDKLKQCDALFSDTSFMFEDCSQVQEYITRLQSITSKLDSVKDVSLPDILDSEFCVDTSIDDVQSLVILCANSINGIATCKTEYARVKEELDEFDICPLCGSDLKGYNHE
jgi:chromosome segregation ATPase